MVSVKNQIHLLPCDQQGAILTSRLPNIDEKTIVVLQAGNVNSGSFDDFDFICRIAQEKQAWVHIDGAFGLWAKASKQKSHLTKSIELADSWSVDAHKTLNAPYDNGIVLFKDKTLIQRALHAVGSYIQYGEHKDGMLFTPAMSRRARAIELWVTMKALGKNGIAKLVEHLCDCAAEFAQKIDQQNGLLVLNDVVFNQVLVGHDHQDKVPQIVQTIQEQGICWCGATVWQNKPAIRVSFCNWATTTNDIDTTVKQFIDANARI